MFLPLPLNYNFKFGLVYTTMYAFFWTPIVYLSLHFITEGLLFICCLFLPLYHLWMYWQYIILLAILFQESDDLINLMVFDEQHHADDLSSPSDQDFMQSSSSERTATSRYDAGSSGYESMFFRVFLFKSRLKHKSRCHFLSVIAI